MAKFIVFRLKGKSIHVSAVPEHMTVDLDRNIPSKHWMKLPSALVLHFQKLLKTIMEVIDG